MLISFGGCRRINKRLGLGESHSILISKGEYPAQEIQQVIATTSGGNIEVVGDATDQATLEVYGSFRSKDSIEIAEKVKEFFDLSINRDNNTLNVNAQQKRNIKTGFLNNGSGVSVHFVIHVRKETINTLKTSGGNISLSHVGGSTQKVNTSGGNLNIEDIQGSIEGETSGGNISLSNITGDVIHLETSGGNIDGNNINGKVDLETSGGNVSVRQGKGSYVLKTSGGNANAENITGILKMSTSGGNVEASNINGGIDGSTSGGAIHVQFASVSSDIILDNSGGGIEISIPTNTKANISIASEDVRSNGLANFSGKSDKHTIEGSLNGGGPTIKAKNNGGSIILNLNN
ncbi:MAG: hypothetical protein DI598_13465 [Pseudopedobacter saltans]|uniref:DUF4097 domain-containing protein n=1 Tax=Pseudopedobacter saltans TaxID=151895 RepID=A0A2W5EVJ0_9SPHI|nr:MAG: hypothetical protein DI598_13465 [Pseudopedobacter saltans]